MKKDVAVLDLTGRLAVVTGASDGTGRVLAGRLAQAGAELILPVRNLAKGQAAVAGLPLGRIRLEQLDLADLSTVSTLAGRLLAEGRPIDLLVNNAGIMTPPSRRLTADGYELQFGTNVIGPAALTLRLLPLLRQGNARVTTVTSAAAKQGRMNWDDLQSERRYRAISAYGQSKLADLIFGLELDRRSQTAGWGLTSNVAHPGTTLSNLYASGPALGRTRPARSQTLLMAGMTRLGLTQPVERGVLGPLYAAVGPKAQGGRMYGPDGFGQFTGNATELPVYRSAQDRRDGERLWQVLHELTGVGE